MDRRRRAARTVALMSLFTMTDTQADVPIASFDGDGSDLISLIVGIEPVQAGSGDPSPDNVRPISGWTGANVTRTGKNIFGAAENGSVSESMAVGTPYTSIVSETVTNRRRNASPIFVNGREFTVSCSSDYSVCMCLFDKNLLYLGYDSGFKNWAKSTTVNNPNAYYICVAYKKDDNSSLNSASDALACVQVEFGLATAYEPYQGETYSITFPTSAGTVYGGTLDVTSGKLTILYGLADLSSIVWNADTKRPGVFYGHISGRKSESAVGVCDAYATKNITVSTSYDMYISGVVSYGGGFVFLRDTRYSGMTGEQFGAVTSGNVVFTLATPIVYDLTPTQVTTLIGANNIWADTGDIKYIEYNI